MTCHRLSRLLVTVIIATGLSACAEPATVISDPAVEPLLAKGGSGGGGGGGSCSISIPRGTTSFTVTPNPVVLTGVGATQQLTVMAGSTVINPCGLSFTTSNSAVATVSSGATGGGVVTAVSGGGPIIITAQTASGKAISGTTSVTVKLADAIEATSAVTQGGTVATAVGAPPAVRVSAGGVGVQGIAVSFTVSGDGSVSQASVVSDAEGNAALTSWTLGTTAGEQTVTAAAPGLTPITFTATAAAGPASAIAATSATSQTATVGSEVAQPPAVSVTDAYGNAKAGVTVAFAVGGGGSIAGSAATTNVTTDASGTASLSSWTVGTTVGAYTVAASVDGIATSVSFTATATAGPASQFAIVDGDGQSGSVGTALANPIRVHALDAYGNPVSGISVTFAATSGGGSLSPASALTDNTGTASAAWTLGTVAGVNSASASAGSVGSVTLSATAVPGAPASLSRNSADNQSTTVGTTVAAAPSVVVEDEYGNRVGGASVSFSVLSGGGAVSPSSTTADGSGVATVTSWTLGTAAGANTVRASAGSASVDFSATGVAGAPSAMVASSTPPSSATVGTGVTAPAVRVTDQYGNGVSGVSVSFAITAGAGSIGATSVTTDATGAASAASWTLSTVAGPNGVQASSAGLTTVTFSVTGTAGAPTSMVALSSTTQSAAKGSDVTPPSVRVTDQYGNNVSGVTVSFAVTLCPIKGSRQDCSSIQPTSGQVSTSASGIASLSSWKLSRTAGSHQVRASLAALTPILFNATGN